jgi:hypothetical protein
MIHLRHQNASFVTRLIRISIVTAAAASTFVGCTALQRSSRSGYSDRDDSSSAASADRERQSTQFDASVDELGLRREKNLTDAQLQAIELRTQLRRAEKTLDGHVELEQYYRNKPYMKNDRDRLEFLRLGSIDDRSRWLVAHGLQGSATPNPPEIQALIDVNDITLGMTKSAVRDAWGEPEVVEVAGNPVFGNERWRYTEQKSSAEGFQTEHRVVYFESGRVVGWENH